MKKQLILLVIVLYLAGAIFAQNSKSLLNKPAPGVNFEKIINYEKSSAQSADYKSKILIIDFWATWCAPCIPEMARLEKLQNKYRDKVKVITVTNEPEDRVRKFLTEVKTTLPIVLDAERKIAALFPHRTLPHTIIIDDQNTVKVIMTSSKVTDEVIDNLIARKMVELAEKKDVMSFDPHNPLPINENSIYQITFTPYQEGFPSMVNEFTSGESIYVNRRIYALNLGIRVLFEVAYRFPPGVRTIIEVKDKDALKWSKQTAYCFELIVPKEIGDQRFSIMQQQLSNMFPYKASLEKREMPVKVLRRIDKDKNLLKSAAGGGSAWSFSGKGFSMKNCEIKVLSDFLEAMLNKPVLNETGITGNYDLELPWYHEKPDNIYKELEKIGLELKNEARPVEVLVIRDK